MPLIKNQETALYFFQESQQVSISKLIQGRLLQELYLKFWRRKNQILFVFLI